METNHNKWVKVLKDCGYEWDGHCDLDAIFRAMDKANEQGWDACWEGVVERAKELDGA